MVRHENEVLVDAARVKQVLRDGLQVVVRTKTGIGGATPLDLYAIGLPGDIASTQIGRRAWDACVNTATDVLSPLQEVILLEMYKNSS